MTHIPRILIVDDDRITVKTLKFSLLKNDYLIDSCFSGMDAIELVKKNEYDLVLLDVVMPVMNGYEACTKIHEISDELPVILITANTEDEYLKEGFDVGAIDYLRKPINQVELQARVKNILRIRAAEKEKEDIYDKLRKEVKLAARIQENMLPKWVYLDEQIIFASHYVPSGDVGGDLFDWIKLDAHRYVAYVADISGHGVQAALLMTAIRNILKMFVENMRTDLHIPTLLNQLNHRLSMELFDTNYMTLILGVIDTRLKQFQFLNAGHPPLLEYNTVTKKTFIYNKKGSVPMGWDTEIKYSDDDIETLQLRDDSVILLYTDGLNESIDEEGNEFGIEGLRSIIENEINVESCITFPFRLKDYMSKKNFNIKQDDFTLFCFQLQDDSNVQRDGVLTKKILFKVRSMLKDVGYTALTCEKKVLEWTGDSRLASEIELVIDEFLNNIIIHGYNYKHDAIIVIEFSFRKDKIAIKFWDKGIEWVPANINYSRENPYSFEDDIFMESGKGIHLVLSMVNCFSRMRFENINETIMEIDIEGK
ncbi:MAG: SpoIIE family protein phosphatase [Candidatus Cloacimonetes bacterium]|nr:SpoIIE family protein phosphatase [Candidatus Cloacimonadota bacterium]